MTQIFCLPKIPAAILNTKRHVAFVSVYLLCGVAGVLGVSCMLLRMVYKARALLSSRTYGAQIARPSHSRVTSVLKQRTLMVPRCVIQFAISAAQHSTTFAHQHKAGSLYNAGSFLMASPLMKKVIKTFDPPLRRLLHQRLANTSASASASSAVLDEDVGVERQSSPSYSRDVQIREVQDSVAT